MKELLLFHDLKEEGRREGIKAFIEAFQEIGLEKEATCSKVMQKFGLAREQAENYIEMYWKQMS